LCLKSIPNIKNTFFTITIFKIILFADIYDKNTISQLRFELQSSQATFYCFYICKA